MADFCKQCTEDAFGPNCNNDFEGVITAEDSARGYVSSTVLCEGCGPIQVDHNGRCVSTDCLENGHPGHK